MAARTRGALSGDAGRRPGASAPPRRGPRKRGGARWLRHGGLVATEAVLLAALLKDWIEAAVLRSQGMPGWGKVLFVMGATVGVLGGVFFAVERLLRGGVARTHSALGALPLPVPGLVAHAVLLAALFLVYARHLGVRVF